MTTVYRPEPEPEPVSSVIREAPQEDDAGGDAVDVSASPEKSEEAIPEEGKCCLFMVV